MELSLIGLQNAGKTSLVNVLTTGSFHEAGGGRGRGGRGCGQPGSIGGLLCSGCWTSQRVVRRMHIG